LAENAPENALADELVPKPEASTVVQPVPRSMTPQFPAKPLKIVSALPDEFYPVELGGDSFAPEPGHDESEEDKGDQ
jgi:hypothetical protein